VARRFFTAVAYATLASLSLAPAAFGASIKQYNTMAAGVPLKVIKVDLNDPAVKITGQFTKYGAGYAEPFGQMVRRVQPTVAVTGTFFSTKSLIPVGDIVIDGRLAHFGGIGTAMCVTQDNTVEFIRPERYTHQDWSRFDFVLCCGPRLITNGVAYVQPKSEGFRDKHMLSRNGRVAVGVTKDNKMIFVATRKPVYLSKLAKAMRSLGVWNAINLDGGSSIGLHYKGKTLIKPSRRLTNLILVYENRDRYEELKDNLLPFSMRTANKQAKKEPEGQSLLNASSDNALLPSPTDPQP
jgi:uncharacterized protein YigE (DUF2233 family)